MEEAENKGGIIKRMAFGMVHMGDLYESCRLGRCLLGGLPERSIFDVLKICGEADSSLSELLVATFSHSCDPDRVGWLMYVFRLSPQGSKHAMAPSALLLRWCLRLG